MNGTLSSTLEKYQNIHILIRILVNIYLKLEGTTSCVTKMYINVTSEVELGCILHLNLDTFLKLSLLLNLGC